MNKESELQAIEGTIGGMMFVVNVFLYFYLFAWPSLPSINMPDIDKRDVALACALVYPATYPTLMVTNVLASQSRPHPSR